MRRSINPDYEFNKEKYADVLRRAIEDRSIAAFSKEVGVSNGYVSRYLNLKCDTTPTILTIKKIAKVTKMVSYSELLEAAGYDSSKYIEDMQELEVSEEELKETPMSYFSLIFASVARADFQWTFSSESSYGSEPFSLKIEDAPFEKWYFIPVTKTNIAIEDILNSLSSIEALEEVPHAKITFVSASPNTCDKIKAMKLGFVSLYISVMQVDTKKGTIVEETYLNTTAKISEEDKEMFSIVKKEPDGFAPFYSI